MLCCVCCVCCVCCAPLRSSSVLKEIKEATIQFLLQVRVPACAQRVRACAHVCMRAMSPSGLQYLPNFNVPPIEGTKETALGTI
jgi:hypothetical protein